MVTLQALKPDDKFHLWEMRNDPRVYRWTRQCGPLSWWEHEKWFDTRAGDSASQVILGIHEGPDTSLIGCGGLTNIDRRHSKAEFSLYIKPELQSHGYGTQALKLIVEMGFKSLNLNSIWGETLEGNPASKVFTKIGFRECGTLIEAYFKEGQYWDSYLYCLTRTIWNEK